MPASFLYRGWVSCACKERTHAHTRPHGMSMHHTHDQQQTDIKSKQSFRHYKPSCNSGLASLPRSLSIVQGPTEPASCNSISVCSYCQRDLHHCCLSNKSCKLLASSRGTRPPHPSWSLVAPFCCPLIFQPELNAAVRASVEESVGDLLRERSATLHRRMEKKLNTDH